MSDSIALSSQASVGRRRSSRPRTAILGHAGGSEQGQRLAHRVEAEHKAACLTSSLAVGKRSETRAKPALTCERAYVKVFISPTPGGVPCGMLRGTLRESTKLWSVCEAALQLSTENRS
jgi:hypothetical protein